MVCDAVSSLEATSDAAGRPVHAGPVSLVVEGESGFPEVGKDRLWGPRPQKQPADIHLAGVQPRRQQRRRWHVLADLLAGVLARLALGPDQAGVERLSLDAAERGNRHPGHERDGARVAIGSGEHLGLRIEGLTLT